MSGNRIRDILIERDWDTHRFLRDEMKRQEEIVERRDREIRKIIFPHPNQKDSGWEDSGEGRGR